MLHSYSKLRSSLYNPVEGLRPHQILPRAALCRPYLADASLTLKLSTQYLLAQTAVLPKTYSTQGTDMSSSAAHTSTSFLRFLLAAFGIVRQNLLAMTAYSSADDLSLLEIENQTSLFLQDKVRRYCDVLDTF